MKNLSTRTELVSDNCNEEEYDNCQIAESTNASDTAISYGIGSGLEIKLLDIENEEDNLSGELSFFINGRYFWGASTEYLKQGSFDLFKTVEDWWIFELTELDVMRKGMRKTNLFV